MEPRDALFGGLLFVLALVIVGCLVYLNFFID